MIDVGSKIDVDGRWFLVRQVSLSTREAVLHCESISPPMEPDPIDASMIEPGDWVRVECRTLRDDHPYIIEAVTREWCGDLWAGPKVIRTRRGTPDDSATIIARTPKPWAPPVGWEDWPAVAIFTRAEQSIPVVFFRSTDGDAFWRTTGDARWVRAHEVIERWKGATWKRVTFGG